MARRKLTLDFDAFVAGLREQPADTADNRRRARAARGLVEALLDHAGEVHEPDFLMALTDEQLEDAHTLVTGEGAGAEWVAGGQDPRDPGGAIQAATEAIDPDAWAQTLDRLRRLSPRPDPEIAGEFI